MRMTAGGVLRRNGQVLLGRRSRDRSYYPGVWDFFGGHCEDPETPEQALVREFEEELGVIPTDFELLAVLDEPAPEQHGPARHTLFVVRDWIGNPKNLGGEHSEIRWFDLAELPSVDLALREYIRLLGSRDRFC